MKILWHSLCQLVSNHFSNNIIYFYLSKGFRRTVQHQHIFMIATAVAIMNKFDTRIIKLTYILLINFSWILTCICKYLSAASLSSSFISFLGSAQNASRVIPILPKNNSTVQIMNYTKYYFDKCPVKFKRDQSYTNSLGSRKSTCNNSFNTLKNYFPWGFLYSVEENLIDFLLLFSTCLQTVSLSHLYIGGELSTLLIIIESV